MRSNNIIKKIEKNNKRIVKKVTKVAKKNPNAAIAITATAGTGFMGLGVLNIVQHMRNKKALKKAKAMDEANASSTNANNTQQPTVQKPTAPTTNETTTTSNTTSGEQVFPAMLQAAFNEFVCVRKDPRSQNWSDEQLADATARRFATDPLSISCIYTYIMDNIEKINLKNLQNAVRTNTAQATQTTEPNTFEVFNEPEETNEVTNPDEGKYPASSKKQQHNGKKGNNKKN